MIDYKSEDGLSNLESAAYFYNEKGDIERYVGIDKVYERIPGLKAQWDEMNYKIKRCHAAFEDYLQGLINEHDPKDWGN